MQLAEQPLTTVSGDLSFELETADSQLLVFGYRHTLLAAAGDKNLVAANEIRMTALTAATPPMVNVGRIL